MKLLLAVVLSLIALPSIAAENLCADPALARMLIDDMNHISSNASGGRYGQVVDLENITTISFTSKGFKCHFTVVGAGLERVPGVMTSRHNIAGDEVVEWVPDWAAATRR